MIDRLLDASIRFRWAVLALTALVAVYGAFQLFRIVTVEHEDDALIGIGLRWFGTIDDEADGRPVGVIAGDGEQNRLISGQFALVGAVRQEAVVPIGPEMRIERIPSCRLLHLDGDAPAAFDALVDERRQRVLQLGFRQMVEKDFGHACIPACDQAS